MAKAPQSYLRNQCLLALLSTLAACVFGFAVRGIFPRPLPLFLAPVVLSVTFGGARAGLLAAALSAGIATYIFVPPTWSFALMPPEQMRVAIFVITSALICLLAAFGNEQRAQRH